MLCIGYLYTRGGTSNAIQCENMLQQIMWTGTTAALTTAAGSPWLVFKSVLASRASAQRCVGAGFMLMISAPYCLHTEHLELSNLVAAQLLSLPP